MRIAVLGAGAIGSLFGGHLALRHEVTLVCRRAHADAVQKNGLRITGLSDIHVHPAATDSALGLEPPDMLLMTVKAYDTQRALATAAALMSEKTTLVSLQNGLGNIELISERLPGAALVAGITSHGAILHSPGIVEHTGKSYTLVGGPGPAKGVASVFCEAGIETTVSRNIEEEIWYKAIVNSAINPLATLLHARNGIVAEESGLERLVSRIVAEGVDVACARGVMLDRDVAFAKAMTVAMETAANVCSMRLDVERGRRTEIMQMNGAIARYGTDVGILTPANALLTALVLALERKA